jgi:hypothetical protein
MLVDTAKQLTPKVPFYSVERFDNGTVFACAKALECKECMFKERCLVKEGE